MLVVEVGASYLRVFALPILLLSAGCTPAPVLHQVTTPSIFEALGRYPADLSQVPYQNIPDIFPLAGMDWKPDEGVHSRKAISK